MQGKGIINTFLFTLSYLRNLSTSWLSPRTSRSFRLIYFIYLFNRFHHDYNAKKTREKIHLNKTQKTRDAGAGHTTERVSKLSDVDITHYVIIKYKNPICKNDKNESLPQPIKSLSSSSYQLIEDYVTYCICSRSTSRC